MQSILASKSQVDLISMQVRNLPFPHAERGGRRGVREDLGLGQEGQDAARPHLGLRRGGAQVGNLIGLSNFCKLSKVTKPSLLDVTLYENILKFKGYPN